MALHVTADIGTRYFKLMREAFEATVLIDGLVREHPFRTPPSHNTPYKPHRKTCRIYTTSYPIITARCRYVTELTDTARTPPEHRLNTA